MTTKLIREKNGVKLTHHFGHGYVIKNGNYETWAERYPEAITLFNYELKYNSGRK